MLVRSSLEEMKYIITFIFSFLRSGVEAKRGGEFHHSTRNAPTRWRTECLNTRFRLPTLQCFYETLYKTNLYPSLLLYGQWASIGWTAVWQPLRHHLPNCRYYLCLDFTFTCMTSLVICLTSLNGMEWMNYIEASRGAEARLVVGSISTRGNEIFIYMYILRKVGNGVS